MFEGVIKILEAETDDLIELSRIAGCHDTGFLIGADLSKADLRDVDFSLHDLSNCKFDNTLINERTVLSSNDKFNEFILVVISFHMGKFVADVKKILSILSKFAKTRNDKYSQQYEMFVSSKYLDSSKVGRFSLKNFIEEEIYEDGYESLLNQYDFFPSRCIFLFNNIDCGVGADREFIENLKYEDISKMSEFISHYLFKKVMRLKEIMISIEASKKDIDYVSDRIINRINILIKELNRGGFHCVYEMNIDNYLFRKRNSAFSFDWDNLNNVFVVRQRFR